MISFVKSWCEGIIVATIISIIVEMLIPEGNNKKYINVVIGIYILFVIIGPVLEKFNIDYNFENFFNFEKIEVSADLNDNIKNVYIDGIEESIKNDLIESGFFVENVTIEADNRFENLEKIEIKLSQNESVIEPIIIGNTIEKNEILNKDFEDIKKEISENYNIVKEKIYIFQ